MNKYLLSKIFFPAYHTLTGTGLMSCLRQARMTQWYSPEQLRRLQQEKLCRLFVHAWNHVPFYRHRFEQAGLTKNDLGNSEALTRIPLLTKQDINRNKENMVARNGAGGRLFANSTSGSTGEALRFFTDMRSWAARRAASIRNQEWMDVFLGDRQVSLWGAPMDIRKSKKLRGVIHQWFNNYTLLSSYDLSPESLRGYVAQLHRFQPVLLTSYPGPLYELARFMCDQNLIGPPLRAIISSAETLYSWQREATIQVFHCPVYNRYGCREFGDIAHECKQHDGLHLNAERVIVEILDQELSPCANGTSGEIVITDLDNFGMPLIRYRIGDQGSFASRQCSCGLGLPLLETIDGRTMDVIRTPSGKAFGGTFWTFLFKSKPGIRSFQVVQSSLDAIVVRYVPDPGVKEIPLAFFAARIYEHCGDAFKVDFEEVEQIEKTASGKTRFIRSLLHEDHMRTPSPRSDV